MSSSVNLNLDEIGVAVADAMQATSQCQCETAVAMGREIGKEVGKEIARQIGKEVGEHVTAALSLQKATFDVREQILANATFILDCYQGSVRYDKPVTIVIANYGGHTVAFVNKSVISQYHTTLLQGPPAKSDIDALQGLYDMSKRALTHAWELRDSPKGFRDIKVLAE